jgi:YfiH family protein
MVDACPGSDGGFRLEVLSNGWLVGRFAALDAIDIPHMVTTRQGPDVHLVRQDTVAAGGQIAKALGLHDVAFLKQVHGGEALVCRNGGLIGEGDALATDFRDLALLGKGADCPIVLIGDRCHKSVGFAHASWRATVAGIVSAVVLRMLDFGSETRDLVACIGPSAGPECYEVGNEVREAALRGIGSHADAFFRPGPNGKDHFDLWQANTDALLRAGVPAESIHVAGVCTMCRNDLFPSHRREGEPAGRFASVLALSRGATCTRC